MGLREVRKKERLSLEALAYLSGVDMGNLSRIERGLIQPRPTTVVKIARGLGMSITTLRGHLADDLRNPANGQGAA